MSIVLGTLILVGLIGLSFPPFEGLSYRAYGLLEPLAMNPSFTPITFDMSMMTSARGENNLNRDIAVFGKMGGVEVLVDPRKMGLYQLKLPLIQYFEQIQDGKDIVEIRRGICHQLGKVLGGSLSGFSLRTPQSLESTIFNRKFSCDDFNQ